MHLAKAIAILHEWGILSAYEVDADLKDAVRLSSEALKAIQAWRKDWEGNRFHLLPGETPPVHKPYRPTLFGKPIL